MFHINDAAHDNMMDTLTDGFDLLNASEYNESFDDIDQNDDAAAFLATNDPFHIEEAKPELPKPPTAASIARSVEAMATAPSSKIERSIVTDQFYRVKHTQIIIAACDSPGGLLVVGEHKNGHREVYNLSDLLIAKKAERFTPYKPAATRKRTAAKKQTTRKRSTAKRSVKKQTAKKQTTRKRSTTKRTSTKPTAKKRTTTKRTTRKQATSRRAA